MAGRPARGVVFDFDGVIARTMEQHAESYRRVLAPYGLAPSDRDIFVQEGARSETILRDALAAADVPHDPALVKRLADAKQQTFRSIGVPPLYPDAEAMVRSVRARTDRVALVTGTRRENLQHVIPGLLPLFTQVLAQDAYTHDKPHPEPYSNAARALGLPPAACAALENAVRGVRSAKAAGYGRVIAITTTMTEADLRAAGCDAVAKDHREAQALLGAWLDGA